MGLSSPARRMSVKLTMLQIQVPLESVSIPSSNSSLPAGAASNELLPMSHLTPRTLLGGSTSTRETVGQLYATQIASVIATKDPQEKRTIVLGLGLGQVEASRTMFYDTIELVLKCL